MATPTELQQIYLAYFGRPADIAGLSFYANTPVATVVQAFSASPESQALYGATFTAASVKAIYSYLFNRPAADSEATFWVGVVNAPGSTVSPAAAALTILQSAHNSDFTGISNKLVVAAAFTSAMDTIAEVAAYSGARAADAVRQFLATVGPDSVSVGTASAEILGHFDAIVAGTTAVAVRPVVPSGTRFDLTTGIDVVNGTAADESIYGTVGNLGTYSSQDTIDGGGGTDTLFLSAGGGPVGSGPVVVTMSNIEKLAVTGGGLFGSLRLGAASGLTDIISNGTGYGSSVDVTDVPNVVNVSILNANQSSTSIRVFTSALTGSNDTVTLTLSGTASDALYYAHPGQLFLGATAPGTNEFETLNVVSNGALPNAMTLMTDSVQTSLKTINITGNTQLSLQLSFDRLPVTATSINASTDTGGVNIGGEGIIVYTLGAADHTVLLGLGDDSVFFGPNLGAGDLVDGGAGVDTVGVSAAVSGSSMPTLRNVEVLRFDMSHGDIVQDAGISALAGLNFAAMGYAPSGTAPVLTLNNLANNARMSLSGSAVATLAESLKNGAGAADSLTLALGDTGALATSLGTLKDIAGLETLRIMSSGSNFITADQVLAAQVVTGSGSLAITAALAATSFDASAFTGNLNVIVGNSATNLRGGSGNDTIQLGAAGTAGVTAAHLVSTGAGNDVVAFVGNNAAGTGAATNYSAFAEITDFNVGTSGATDAVLFNSSTSTGFSLRDAAGTVHSGLVAGFNLPVSVAQNASVAAAFANVALKLQTGVAFATDIASTFASAIGSGMVTGLLANANYVVTAYDSSHGKAVLAVVNTGASHAGDTTLSAADFTAGGVAVVGVLDMTSADYAHLSGPQIGAQTGF